MPSNARDMESFRIIRMDISHICNVPNALRSRTSMSEPKYITILPVPEGTENEVRRLFETINDKDPTWIWEFKRVDEELKVLVYSRGKNQAKMRGEWLTHNTDLFISQPYQTTHNLTLRTVLKEKPKQVEGLRTLLKRDKIWKKAGKGESEKPV